MLAQKNITANTVAYVLDGYHLDALDGDGWLHELGLDLSRKHWTQHDRLGNLLLALEASGPERSIADESNDGAVSAMVLRTGSQKINESLVRTGHSLTLGCLMLA